LISLFFYQTGLFIFFYFLGKKISENIKLKLKFEILENNINLNFLFSLFLLTIIPFFLNFFVPIKNYILIIIFSFLIIWVFFKIKISKKDIRNILTLILISLFLIPFLIYVDIGHDAGLYHVPFQTWIKNYKITFGLSTLHSRYGLTAGYDYLSSLFWIKDFFILNAALQSSFIVLFFSYFLNLAENKKNYVLFLVPVIFLFPIWQRYIIFDFGIVDFSFGVLAMLTILQSIKIFNLETKNKKILLKELFILFILSTFVIISKTTGIIFLILLLIILFCLRKQFLSLIKNKSLQIISFFCLILICAWFLRNIIISGCLIYPIELSCANLSWYNQDNLTRDLTLISKYKEHYSTIIDYSLNIFLNFKNLLSILFILFLILIWINTKKNKFLLNEIILFFSIIIIIGFTNLNSLRGFSDISAIAILSKDYVLRDIKIFDEMIKIIVTSFTAIIFVLAFIKKLKKPIKFNLNLNNLLIFIFVFLCLITWFLSSPDPRLGFWIFALLPSLFLLTFLKLNFNLKKVNLNIFIKSILLINIFLIFTLNILYIQRNGKIVEIFYDNKTFENRSIIVKRNYFGYKPTVQLNENGSISNFTWNYCWDFVDCYYNDYDADLKELKYNYYKIVTLKN